MHYICGVNRWLVLGLTLLLCNCNSTAPDVTVVDFTLEDTTNHFVDTVVPLDALAIIDTMPSKDTAETLGFIGTTPLEQAMIDSGLVRLLDLDSTFIINLKYSTTDNFLGVDVYGDFNEAYLQPEVAKKVALAQAWLRDKDSTMTLIVYDATRPRSVQQKMWDILDMPAAEKGKFVSNPASGKGSLHNYGAAVDVSIARNGIPLDMGTPFDHIGELAYPRLEQAMLDSGVLTQEIINNRKLLRRTMRKGGLWGIQTEWWHFNSCRRDTAIKYYPIIE
jgi:D-alanyl-D-alanine dipeptidase